MNYSGHGSITKAGTYSESFITAAGAEVLENSTYPIFSALTCGVAEDTVPGLRSLAGALVLNPTGGAIAVFAPTGLSLDVDAQLLGAAFVDSLFGAVDASIGQAVVEARASTEGNVAAFMHDIYTVMGEPAIHPY
jgi:hypothetical protein